MNENKHLFLELDALADSIERVCEPPDLRSRLVAAFSPFAERLQQQMEDISRGLRVALEAPGISETLKSLEAVLERAKELPDRIKEQVITLAQHGWYFDPQMTLVDVARIKRDFEKGEGDAATVWFIRYFRENLDEIEQRLASSHPSRAKIISAACRAHRAGDYELSVPVFLAQADGIAADLHNRQLYSRQDNKGVSGLVDKLPDDFHRAMWAVYKENLPLTSKTSGLPEGFDGLNRHAVLHGIDPNYGTEINSLRALSLLNYASFSLANQA